MCWLYVPGQEASSSASGSPTPERMASVTWRGTPIQPQSLPRAWQTGPYDRLLFGLTSPPSMLDRGVESWIASLRATRASQTPPPGSSVGPTTSGSLSIRSCASWKSAGLIVSSERTSRGTSLGNSPRWSRVFGDWGTALQQEYSVRPKPAALTGGPGFSLWPTPLAHEIRLGYQQRPADKKGTQISLTTAVVDWTLCRYSLPRPGAKSGPESSTPPWVLNPRFAEWLMGLPIGWTRLEPLATPSARWLQRMRGRLSTLCSLRAQVSQPKLL